MSNTSRSSARGRWGRGGRLGTHLHLELFGWGPKGREFKSRRPDCGGAGDVRKLIRRDFRAPAASDRMNRSSPLSVPESPALSSSQLAKVTDLGEERTADAGDLLFQVGDHDYPFIAILTGEVAMLDGA